MLELCLTYTFEQRDKWQLPIVRLPVSGESAEVRDVHGQSGEPSSDTSHRRHPQPRSLGSMDCSWCIEKAGAMSVSRLQGDPDYHSQRSGKHKNRLRPEHHTQLVRWNQHERELQCPIQEVRDHSSCRNLRRLRKMIGKICKAGPNRCNHVRDALRSICRLYSEPEECQYCSSHNGKIRKPISI